MKNYSKEIASTISSFLTADNWHFSFIEDKGIFRFGVGLKGKLKKIDYLVDVKEDDYLVYAHAPLGADEHAPLNDVEDGRICLSCELRLEERLL